MTPRIVTHRVDHRSDPPVVVELPETLQGLRDQHGTLGLIGFLAQLEASDAAHFRARLEPTPAADADQLATALWRFLAQATRRHEPAVRAPTRPDVDLAWGRR